MGGGGGGKGGFADFVFNPVSAIVGKDTGGSLDPLGSMAAQATKNIYNVAAGKESFGAHNNWFGRGATADFLNPMMGGRTSAQEDQWKEYEKTNKKAWAEWSEKTGKKNPYPEKKDSVGSFLFDEETL